MEIQQAYDHWKGLLLNRAEIQSIFSVDSSMVVNHLNYKFITFFVISRDKSKGEMDFLSDICNAGIPDTIISSFAKIKMRHEFLVMRHMFCSCKNHSVFDLWKKSTNLEKERETQPSYCR